MKPESGALQPREANDTETNVDANAPRQKTPARPMRIPCLSISALFNRTPGQVLLIAGAILAVYGPAFHPERTFSGMDFINLLYPHAVVARRAFAEGAVPLWNWYNWGGSPFLAPMQAAVLYPPTWLTLLFPLPWGLQLGVLAHLVLAGWGAGRLAVRHFGVSAPCSLYGAIAYAAGGFLFGHLEQLNSVASIAWTPWIISAGLDILTPHGRVLPFVLCCSMALLAGHPQYLALTGLFLGLMIAVRMAAKQLPERKTPGREDETAEGKRPAARRLPMLAAAALVAGALSAAQLLPTRELAQLSERVWPYPDPHDPALRATWLPALLIPRYYNHLTQTAGRPLGMTESGLYSGLLSGPLFLLGVAEVLRHRSAAGIALLVVWAASLYYALGSVQIGGIEMGLAPLVLKLVPFLAQSRGSARALNVESLAMAILAARGLTLLGSASFLRHRLRALAPAVTAAILVLDLAITHRPELSSRLVSADVLTMPIPSALWARLRPNSADDTPRPERLYRLMAHDSDYYLDDRQAAVVQRRLRLQPNLNAVECIAAIDGYEEGLLPTRSWANFLRRYNRNLRSDNPDAALLALLGCNTLLTEYPIRGEDTPWKPDGIRSSSLGGPLSLWRSGYPAAWFLDRTTLDDAAGRSTRPDQAWAEAAIQGDAWRNSGTTPEQACLPYREPLGQERRSHPYDSLSPADFARAADAVPFRVAEMRPNSLRLVAKDNPAETAGNGQEILFLQAPYPGWKFRCAESGESGLRATEQVLKRRAPVYSTFTWQNGISGNGSGTEIVYSPYSFRLGLFVSLATAALLLGARSARIRTISLT